MLLSARRGISYPNPDWSDRPDVPAHIGNLVTALELDMIYAQGTNATRLARAHMAGVTFYETDTTLSYYDDGAAWHPVRGTAGAIGTELDYAQITSNSAGITATTEGTAVAIITGNSVAYDGSRNRIEFFAPSGVHSAAMTTTFVVFRDATAIGQARVSVTATAQAPLYYFVMFDTPSAANHTYKVSAYVSAGTYTVQASTGGAGALLPAFLRVVRTT